MPITRVFDRSRWASLVASFLSAAVLCGVIAYWAMIMSAPRIAIAPADSLIDRGAPSDLGPAQRLFGQIAGAAPSMGDAVPSNITVIGIVASTRNGSAILLIDGNATRPVGVGEEIEPGLKLTSVSAKEVILERNGVELRLPAPPGADLEVLTRGADPSGPDTTPPAAVSAAPRPAAGPAGGVQGPAVAVPAPAPAPAPVRPTPAPTASPGSVGLSPGSSSVLPASSVLRRRLERARSSTSGGEE